LKLLWVRKPSKRRMRVTAACVELGSLSKHWPRAIAPQAFAQIRVRVTYFFAAVVLTLLMVACCCCWRSLLVLRLLLITTTQTPHQTFMCSFFGLTHPPLPIETTRCDFAVDSIVLTVSVVYCVVFRLIFVAAFLCVSWSFACCCWLCWFSGALSVVCWLCVLDITAT
jgi:hypothetical protein